ncbi:MAG: phenylphosphate carboxylase subunit gamma [Deltaproteobacteria bacterium]|nr:phenylphosphate carboxylase subunit gamma [Deltaproteobacteria bacterium]
MASTNERKSWETFVRRPGDIREGAEIPLVLRDLTPGRKKYTMRHVVAIVSRNPQDLSKTDTLHVRTVVGVRLPDTWGVKILWDLPIEIPGRPYKDFFAALSTAAREVSAKEK